jgi:site-specific recombinase XerD
VLRHSFATCLLESDGRLNVIQKLLGHEWLSTTCRYTHIERGLLKTVKSPIDIPASQFVATKKGGRNG